MRWQVDLLSPDALYPLFLTDDRQVIEVQECKVKGFDTETCLVPEVFYGIQVWRKCWPLHLRYTSLQEPFPNDATSMSWGIVIQEDEN